MEATESSVETKDQIFNVIKRLIGEVIGEEFMSQYNVTMESTLTMDLEMESIEIVELSEKVKKHYGAKVDFTNWMSNLELEQIINLSVQDVVNYIDQCQR